MHRIDGPGHSSNQFTEGNDAAGAQATQLTDDWLNALQEEIAGVIEDAGLTLDKEDNTQLTQAIAIHLAQTFATRAEAITGSLTGKYMSPQRTVDLVANEVVACSPWSLANFVLHKQWLTYTLGGTGTPSSLAFGDAGSRMYVAGTAPGATIYGYQLSIPYDLDTISTETSKDVSAQVTTIHAVRFKPDGTKMYVLDVAGVVYQYTLATPWDITTASYDSISLSIAAQESSARGFDISDDGTKLYAVGAANSTIYQYTLSAAWSLSGASYASISKSVSAQSTAGDGAGIKLGASGTKLYYFARTNERVYQYTLSTPYDISTASYDSLYIDLFAETTEILAADIDVSDDGETLFTVHTGGDHVIAWALAQTYTGRVESHLATFAVEADATEGSGIAPGPEDNFKALFLGTGAFKTAGPKFQIKKNSAGVYSIRLPAGLTWDDVSLHSCGFATAGAIMGPVYRVNSTDLAISATTHGGVLTDSKFWARFDLIR